MSANITVNDWNTRFQATTGRTAEAGALIDIKAQLDNEPNRIDRKTLWVIPKERGRELLNTIKTHTRTIEQLQKALGDSQDPNNLAVDTAALAIVESDRERLQIQLNTANGKIDEFEKRIKRDRNTTYEIQKDVEKQATRLEKCLSDRSRLRSHRTAHLETITRIRGQRDVLNEENTRLRTANTDLSTKAEKVTALEAEVSSLKAASAKHAGAIASKDQMLRTQKEQSDKSYNDLKEIYDKCKLNEDDLQRRVEKLEGDDTSAVATLKSTQRERLQKQEKRADAAEELQRADKLAYDQEIQTVTNDRNTARQERNTAQTEKGAAETELVKAKHSIQTLESEKATFDQEKSTRDLKQEQLQTANDDLTKKVKDMEPKVVELEQTKSTLESETADQRTTKSTLQDIEHAFKTYKEENILVQVEGDLSYSMCLKLLQDEEGNHADTQARLGRVSNYYRWAVFLIHLHNAARNATARQLAAVRQDLATSQTTVTQLTDQATRNLQALTDVVARFGLVQPVGTDIAGLIANLNFIQSELFRFAANLTVAVNKAALNSQLNMTVDPRAAGASILQITDALGQMAITTRSNHGHATAGIETLKTLLMQSRQAVQDFKQKMALPDEEEQPPLGAAVSSNQTVATSPLGATDFDAVYRPVVERAQSDLVDCLKGVGDLRALLTQVEGTVTTRQEEITTLNSTIEGLRAEVADLGESKTRDVSAIQTKLTEVETQLTEAETQRTEAETTVTTKEEEITTMNSTIEGLRTEVADLGESRTRDVDAIQTKLTEVETQLTEAETQHGESQRSLQEVREELGGMTTARNETAEELRQANLLHQDLEESYAALDRVMAGMVEDLL